MLDADHHTKVDLATDGTLNGDPRLAAAFERPSRFATFANRMMYSTWYTVVYFILFGLQLFLLIWGAVNHSQVIEDRASLAWYITLDVLITVILAAEVVIRLIATHQTYWKSWLNRIDFVVMIICVGALFVWIAEPGGIFVDAAIVSFRYCVQLVRVALVCKQYANTHTHIY